MFAKWNEQYQLLMIRTRFLSQAVAFWLSLLAILELSSLCSAIYRNYAEIGSELFWHSVEIGLFLILFVLYCFSYVRFIDIGQFSLFGFFVLFFLLLIFSALTIASGFAIALVSGFTILRRLIRLLLRGPYLYFLVFYDL